MVDCHLERSIGDSVSLEATRMLGIKVARRFVYWPLLGRPSLPFRLAQQSQIQPQFRINLHQRYGIRSWAWQQKAICSSKFPYTTPIRCVSSHYTASSGYLEVLYKFLDDLTNAQHEKLFKLAAPEKKNILTAISLVLFSSTITMAVPLCVGKVIDIITMPSGVEMLSKIQSMSWILATVFVLGAAANAGRVYLMNVSGHRIANTLRKELYRSLLEEKLGSFNPKKLKELVDNRLYADPAVVGFSFTTNVSNGVRASFVTVMGTAMMIYICPSMTFAGLAMVPPVAAVALIYSLILKKLSTSVGEGLKETSKVAEIRLKNIMTVQAFGQEELETQHYNKKLQDVLALVKKESLARAALLGMTGLGANLVALAALYHGGLMMGDSLMTIGQLTAFLMYAAYVGKSLGDIGKFCSECNSALEASVRLWEFMTLEVRPTPTRILGKSFDPPDITLPEVQGEIKIRNVDFSYPGESCYVLKNINLTIPAGSKTAIVGPSSSGKSTLAALLLGFYDTSEKKGEILLDGNDLRDLEMSWLREQIGFVSQDPVLISGSIRDIVKYGAIYPDLVTDEQIIQALEHANAWEYVGSCTHQLDTLITGEDENKPPAGEKQKLAIARALMRNPRILILDEATSALNAEKEQLVYQSLFNVMKGRTLIIIAHRLSTLTDVDQIAVLHNGMVVELGTYNQLMEIPNGEFKLLLERQSLRDITKHQ